MSAPSGDGAVRVERDGPITTVRLSRPHARNAVDGPTAAALADAFRAFDADGPIGPTRMRVAEESAVLGMYCRRWGVPLIDGGTVRLPRLVGAGRAMDMVLTGRSVAAAEALTIGLVDRVVPEGEALAAAQRLAAEFRHGMRSMAVDALPGAARFAAGEGRHGEGVG